jgi:predicted nucleotidyltransferase
MSELDGVKMRVIALDELMKCCAEIGRTSDNQEHKDFARALFEVARTRHDFLSASRTVEDKG